VIRAGRTAVDTAGLAALHGLTPRQARDAQPWNTEGHPARVTTGTRSRDQPDLWDAEQAAAFAQRKPIPPLPTADHEDDLLDRNECAELVDVTPKTWTDYQSQGKVPEPDRDVCGREHWYRRTVEKWRDDRARRTGTPPGGRPPGSTEQRPRAELAQHIRELVAAGETNVAAIAREAGCAYSTARRHVEDLRRNNAVAR
jgi:phage terminase Nu1 subunit (DNA packaging protein)